MDWSVEKITGKFIKNEIYFFILNSLIIYNII